MPDDRRQAQHAHQRHVQRIGDRRPEERRDQRQAACRRDAGPEEARLRPVDARHQPREQAVDREHQGRDQRDQRPGAEHLEARPQDDQNAEQPDQDRHAPPPADVFAEHRPGQRRDQQRIDREHRMRPDQPELHEDHHHDDDLRRQQQPAQDLQAQPLGARHPADAAAPARRQSQDEGGEDPEADRDDGHDAVVRSEMPRDRVLAGEDRGGQDHQQDALARIASGHGRIPPVGTGASPGTRTAWSRPGQGVAPSRRSTPAAWGSRGGMGYPSGAGGS